MVGVNLFFCILLPQIMYTVFDGSVFAVVFITGRDVEQIVEVEHTSAHSDVQDWIRQGVFCGKPRFHYSLIFDTKTRSVINVIVLLKNIFNYE